MHSRRTRSLPTILLGLATTLAGLFVIAMQSENEMALLGLPGLIGVLLLLYLCCTCVLEFAQGNGHPRLFTLLVSVVLGASAAGLVRILGAEYAASPGGLLVWVGMVLTVAASVGWRE